MDSAEKKKKPKKPEPTTRKYLVYCEGCNASSQHFMTGVEYYAKTIIKQWRKVCDKMTNWKLSLFKESGKK